MRRPIISLAPFSASFLELFVNLAKYLVACGVDVEFLNPDKFVAHELRKFGFPIQKYGATEENRHFYANDSELIRYHSRLYRIGNVQKFVSIKNHEYNSCLAFFKSNARERVVLFWNGSGTVEKDVVERLSVPAFYLENGYFPNTLQVNRGGVNCNADFARLSISEFMGFMYPVKNAKRLDFEMVRYAPNPAKRMFMRLFDPKFNFMLKEAVLYNKRSAVAKRRFASLPVDEYDLPTKGEYIFFPLQVNSDTQIILNSGYDSMYDAVERILPELLKTGKKIIMKEHPFEVECVDYSRFVDGENVILLKKYDLNALIDNAAFTVNINSSVGLQAIERGGNVLLLGSAMYRNAPNCVEYKNYESIERLISLSENPSSYIDHFKNNIFIEGDWKVPDVFLLHKIADRVLG